MGLRDLVLIMTFVACVPVILFRPWTGTLVWSWIGFMNPHRLGWGIANTLPVAAFFGGLTLITMVFERDKKGIPLTAETGLIALLALHMTVTTIFAWAPEQAWDQWEKVIKILLFTFVIIVLVTTTFRIKALVWVIVLSIGFYGFKGGLFSIATGGQYRVMGPAQSFIGANTSLGLAMLMVLPLLFALARLADRRWLKLALLGGAGLTVLAIIFTYSRGALLGLAAIAPFLFIYSRHKGLLVLLIIPVLVAVPAMMPDKLVNRAETIEDYKQDESAMQRIQAWGVAFNVALDRPVVGGGFKLAYVPNGQWLSYATFMGDWHNRARAAHSNYFQMLGEHGFVGLGLYLALIFAHFRQLRSIRKESRELAGMEWMGEIAAAIGIGMVAYVVSGAFLSLAYFDLFYAFVAVGVILRRHLNETKTASEQPKNAQLRRLGGAANPQPV